MAYQKSYQIRAGTAHDLGLKIHTLLAELLADQEGLKITSLEIHGEAVSDSLHINEEGNLVYSNREKKVA